MHTLANSWDTPVFVHRMGWIPNLLILETVGKFLGLVVSVLAHRASVALLIIHNGLSSLIQFLQLHITQKMFWTHVSCVNSIIIRSMLWALGTTAQVSIRVAQSRVLDFVSSLSKSGQTWGLSGPSLSGRGIGSLKTSIGCHGTGPIMDQLALLNTLD